MAISARHLAKGLLAINLGSLVRLLRYGAQDFRESLVETFEVVDPGKVRDDISRLVATYCVGQGVEVGPGTRPYCDPARTVFVDKFDRARNRLTVQRIEDAWILPFRANQFDYLLSAHCLEHCPDAIRTLLEWKRVVRPGGHIVLILPHALRTFDRGRTLTTLAHHVEDYRTGVSMDDPTHREEFERIAVTNGNHWWMAVPDAYREDGSLNWPSTSTGTSTITCGPATRWSTWCGT
jgi:SAM-dependent methyltransferase